MDKQETSVTTNAEENEGATPRPWVTPNFERTELKEALSGGKSPSADGAPNYS